MHVSYGLMYMYMYRGMFGASDFKRLVSHVDGFSLMTYDYSQPGRYNVMCYAMFSVYTVVSRISAHVHVPHFKGSM